MKQQKTSETFDSLPRTDWQVFSAAMILLLSIAFMVVWQPEAVRLWVEEGLYWITHQWGLLLLLFGAFAFVFLVWLAFSHHGDILLGSEGDKPEFSDFSWVCMLFCAGIGISIVNWAFVEPVALMHESPLAIAAGSIKAAEYAAMYSQFHWGIIPWSIYTVATIPVAYSLYVLKEPFLRLSTTARPLLGSWVERWPGKVIDLVVIFSIVGGVGTSLGLSVPLVSTLFGQIVGIEQSFGLQVMFLLAWTLLFGFSVSRGLSKGIKLLSDINVFLAFALLLFVLVVGPTVFIFKLWANSLGLYLDNFVRLSLWTDPFAQTSFTQNWTIFYWAWWITYTPMMALFVARISRGRRVKEVILNQVLWGSAGCMAFFAIWGGYSLFLETQGVVSVSSLYQQQGIAPAVIAVLDTLPGGKLILGLFMLLCFIFLATTLDSAAYTLASVSTERLSGYQEPSLRNRLVWAIIIAVVGLMLLRIGGLDIVQISTLVVSLPMVFVLLLICWSFKRALKSTSNSLTESVEPCAKVD